jgi:thiol-disulfide isomerase/thioredoxin
LLLGKPAPGLRMLSIPAEHFIQAKTDTAAQNNPHSGSFTDLYQINARYTILAFWESDCGHCKIIIPELYEIYQKLKSKGVQVMAVHMLGGVEGKKKWINFINEHELYDWLNVWNPYDYNYKKLYDISSTPVVFILDKDKKIIGKRLEPKQIEEFLNLLITREEKKSN